MNGWLTLHILVPIDVESLHTPPHMLTQENSPQHQTHPAPACVWETTDMFLDVGGELYLPPIKDMLESTCIPQNVSLFRNRVSTD